MECVGSQKRHEKRVLRRSENCIKKEHLEQARVTPVILATQEAEIRRTRIGS
jgi:hypothetical protein